MRYKNLVGAVLAAMGGFVIASGGINDSREGRRSLFAPFGAAYGLAGIRYYVPCRKTVTAAALKRAAKKRRNLRARSPK